MILQFESPPFIQVRPEKSRSSNLDTPSVFRQKKYLDQSNLCNYNYQMFVLRFPLFDILQGETRHRLIIAPSDIDLEYGGVEFFEDITVDLLFSRFAGTISIKANISTPLRMTCARCLNAFELTLESAVELQVKTERRGAGLADFLDEDFAFLNDTNGVIDIRERIREEIILDIPRIPLCRQDCRGIDYTQSVGKAISDPRWETLTKINKEID